MLLDSLAIKTVFLDLPNCGAEEKQPPSSLYVKFVTKAMAKAETLLKVVLTPLEPPELIIKNYMILSSDQNSMEADGKPSFTPQKIAEMKEGFAKILELKGVRKSDQQPLIDLLMKRMPRSGQIVQTSSTAPSPAIPAPPPLPSSSSGMSGLSSFASGLASISISSPSQPLLKSNISDAGTKFNQNIKKLAAVMEIRSASWLKKDNPPSSGNPPSSPTK